MKKTIQIQILEILKNISIHSPYSRKTNEDYKSLGGHFDKPGRRWLVPDNAESRSKLDELFGTVSPSVIANVTQKDLVACGSQLHHGGYLVATWNDERKCVQLAEGVDFVSGSWDLAASASSKMPCLSGPDAELNIVVRRDYAEKHGLSIIEELIDEPVANPLARYADFDLKAELEGGGIVSLPGGSIKEQ